MSYTQILPRIYGNAPQAAGERPMNDRAARFAVAWMDLLGDRARDLILDDRLVTAAQEHANYLASRADTLPSMHIGRNGSKANARVLAAGYPLPSHYEPDTNNVESCSRSWHDPATTAKLLAAHDTHVDHMMFLGGFSYHTHWGVGSAGNDGVYYVCLTAPEER